MSLDYSVEMSADLSDKDVQRLLEGLVEGAASEQPSLWFRAYVEDDPSNLEVTKEEFGFLPTVSVFASLGANRDVDHQLLLRAVNELLLCQLGNLVLLFNGEFIELQRLDGEVEVNSENEWLEGELEQLTVPYAFVPIKQSSNHGPLAR